MPTSEQLTLWAREYQRLTARWGYQRDVPDHTTSEALLAEIAADQSEAVDHIRRHAEATTHGKNDTYWEEEAEVMIDGFNADVGVLRQFIEDASG